MASLQDQLLKAGLVDEKKAKKANKDQRKKNKVAQKSKQPQVDENKAAAQQSIQDKAVRDRELNKKQQELAEKKAIAAQIKQLIQVNKIDKKHGDIAFNFEHGGKFKKIYVSKQLQTLLSKGLLAIVKLTHSGNESFEVVVIPVAEKIAQRDAASVILLNDKTQNTTAELSKEEEEWYGDYDIPDDLMW